MSLEDFSDDLLKFYYKKLFPCDLFCKWLTYGSEPLARREFSFTLAGDIYLRYQSFESSIDLKKELINLCPHKIDIGAVYPTAPKKHRAVLPSSFKPEWKELVFDIDLTDYDDVRYCCGEQSDSATTAVCDRCWPLAQSAILCIDRALREDFGFEHLLWVYSGRRGVHCWVCDAAARRLDPSERTAIVEYLTLTRGGNARKPALTAGGRHDNKGASFIEPLLHPSVDAAYNILLPRFNSYCTAKQGQNLFGVPSRLKKLLTFLPDDLSATRDPLAQEWCENPSDGVEEVSLKRWNTLRTFLKESKRVNVAKEIVLNYCYPRLDVNVSTGLNHLLKSPFCVHPKTGHVCIPIDPNHADSFFPSQVPRLSQLVEELGTRTDEPDAVKDTTDRHLLNYKKTSLKASVEFFARFVERLTASQTALDKNSANESNHQSVTAF